MGFIKIFAALAIFFVSILGVLRVFNVMTPEQFGEASAKGLVALAILFFASFAVSALTSKKKTTETSPTKNGPQF